MEQKLEAKRNVPTTLAHLKGIHARAVAVQAQQGKALADFNWQVDKRIADNQRRLEMTDPRHRGELGRILAEEHKDWMKSFRMETDEPRWKDAKELTALKDDSLVASALLTNPVALATVFEFGKPERNAMAAEVNGLGPAAMRNLATVAVQSGNKAMIGALVVANDKLPKGDRAISSQEIATAVFGAEAEEAAKIIAAIDKMHSQVIAAVRVTEGKPLSSVEKISYGLKHEGHAVQPRPTGTLKLKTSVDRISEGLATG
jgi:hypothetical protein